MLFNPSREEARDFLFESWRKRGAGEVLTPLEALAAALIERHPEYHAVLEDPARHRDRDYLPGNGAVNPFLHLMMHLTIAEQVSIDQPAGIRARFAHLVRQRGSEHDAQHRMMECLAEMIRQAQHRGAPPDAAVYFECLDRR